MGIRAKTLVALALTLGFGIGVLFLTLRGFLLDSFLRSENEQVRQVFGQVALQVDFLLAELAAKSAVYAAGEDTRSSGERGASAPAPGRFAAAALSGDALALAAVVDPGGALVAGAVLDPATQAYSPPSAAFLEYLRGTPALSDPAQPRSLIKGIVPLGGQPLLLVSRPIGRAATGSGRGTLLLGRFLELDRRPRPMAPGGALDVSPVGAVLHRDAETRKALAALSGGEEIFISRPNAQIMAGHGLLRDLAGKPAFLLRLNLERSVYGNGLLSLKILLFAFGIVLLATAGIYVLLIERTVLRRVIRLGSAVQRVGAGVAPAEEIVPEGADEIGTLSGQVRDAFLSEQRLKRELEEARQALERRVEERTCDLRRTIEALNQEVAVRREAEAQVRELELQQRAVIDHMVGGLVTFDENLCVTRVNPAALRLLRVAPSCVGRPLARTLPEDFAADIAAAFAGGAPTVERRETRAAFADGREMTLGYVLSRIPPSAGRGAQGIVLFRDLTDERRLAEQQQRLNRLTTLGEFSAQVAHELRNPLTAMSSTVQYLAAASDGPDRELLRIISESIGRMEGIIRRLRLLSREMPVTRTDVDLGELLRQLLLFLEASLRAQGIATAYRPAATPTLVTGDPAQLHQALLNLLMNAMQAMPRGGRLRVRLARGGPPAGGGAPPVLILIADSGAGISPQVAGRIFDPFYTTREAGTGLGLPIADKIVREHGGGIRFTSRPGRGACFAVILPGSGSG